MAGKRRRANCFSPLAVGFGRGRLHRLALAGHPHKRHPVDARSFNLWWVLHLGSILSHHRSLTIGFGESVCSMAHRSSSMYSRATPFGSIATLLLYCRYLAMDVAIAASWSLLSNQDCISNILASFTGPLSAILTYRLYSSIDLLLHSTFTHRRWF